MISVAWLYVQNRHVHSAIRTILAIFPGLEDGLASGSSSPLGGDIGSGTLLGVYYSSQLWLFGWRDICGRLLGYSRGFGVLASRTFGLSRFLYFLGLSVRLADWRLVAVLVYAFGGVSGLTSFGFGVERNATTNVMSWSRALRSVPYAFQS